MSASALSWATFGVVVATAVGALGAFWVANRARVGANLIEAIRFLQSAEMRRNRAIVYNLTLSPQELERPENRETLDRIEEVAQIYNVIGLMYSERMLKRRPFIRNWGFSILRSWKKLEPWILHRRCRDGDPKMWSEFEEMVKRETRRRKRRELPVPQ